MYTALVLDEENHQKLVRRFVHLIPPEWDIIAHHMTISMGPISKSPVDPSLLGEEAMLTVVSIAVSEKVMAVGVTSDIPSQNSRKHITLAVNRAIGGKPFMSNQLATWEEIPEQMELYGTIIQVE